MPANIVNLTVHGIGRPRRALDPGEDESWVTVEQFEQVLDAVVGIANVRMTFDGGNASDVEIALPRLLERRLTAEFFVLAGCLGERGRVDRDGVHELVDAGMTIGSHGWSHSDWRRLDDRRAFRPERPWAAVVTCALDDLLLDLPHLAVRSCHRCRKPLHGIARGL